MFTRTVLALLVTAVADAQAEEIVVFQGMCDASAATAIDGEHFLVADDEDNILRIYRGTGGRPMAEFDLNNFLGTKKKSDEADLEGAAKLGTLNFWIGSHGRNSKAKESPFRQTLFATEAKREGETWQVKPIGKPYTHLLDDLLADQRLQKYGLKEASELAPKAAGALNIEGLAATPEGQLLIGFRNPLPGGKAIIVPVLNPRNLLEGERAKLGEAIELDLGGLGIRSIGYHKGRYLVLAGAFDDVRKPQFFEWAGGAAKPKPLSVTLTGLNPEGLSFRKGEQERYLLLSDDGTETVDGRDCKKLKDPEQKRFRGTWMEL